MSDYTIKKVCKGTYVVFYTPTNTVMTAPSGFERTRKELDILRKEELEYQQSFIEFEDKGDNYSTRELTYKGL